MWKLPVREGRSVAAFGLVSHWMQLQTAKQREMKDGGDCCVCFVCADEKCVL